MPIFLNYLLTEALHLCKFAEKFLFQRCLHKMITFPNAKINIGLNITERRADGYHNIESIMYPIGWHDILEAVPAKGNKTTLKVSGNRVDCPMEKNLVYRAWERMGREVDLPPVDIYLRKIIPDGAGLGGGSADAAFMLTLLNNLFALDFSMEELAAMASDLGADCPFFIYNRPMLATGTGTELRPIEILGEAPIVAVVKPKMSVSTREAYSSVTPAILACGLTTLAADDKISWTSLLAIAKNDFEESVSAMIPQVAEIRNTLLGLGACYAAMSGSGSAVFGLFSAATYTDKLSASIAQAFPELAWRVCATE